MKTPMTDRTYLALMLFSYVLTMAYLLDMLSGYHILSVSNIMCFTNGYICSVATMYWYTAQKYWEQKLKELTAKSQGG